MSDGWYLCGFKCTRQVETEADISESIRLLCTKFDPYNVPTLMNNLLTNKTNQESACTFKPVKNPELDRY